MQSTNTNARRGRRRRKGEEKGEVGEKRWGKCSQSGEKKGEVRNSGDKERNPQQKTKLKATIQIGKKKRMAMKNWTWKRKGKGLRKGWKSMSSGIQSGSAETKEGINICLRIRAGKS